ncbi:MAG: hypothetical protein ACI822_001814, partial [Gammaproteobacteria bacterium]
QLIIFGCANVKKMPITGWKVTVRPGCWNDKVHVLAFVRSRLVASGSFPPN